MRFTIEIYSRNPLIDALETNKKTLNGIQFASFFCGRWEGGRVLGVYKEMRNILNIHKHSGYGTKKCTIA